MKDGRRKAEGGKYRWYFSSSVFLLLSFALTAQQPPRFQSGVEIVQLDVAVLDRQRRPVTGLTADDFTILEDGKPQPIVAFEELSSPDFDGSVVPWMRDIAPDVRTNSAEGHRIFAFVLDDVSIAGGVNELQYVDTVKKIARTFVERMGPLDQASIVFTGNNRLAQDFTSDRRALLAVIDRFHGTMVPGYLRDLYPTSVVGRAAKSLIEVSHRRKAMIYIGSGLRIPSDVEIGSSGLGANPDSAGRSQIMNEVDESIGQAQRANVSIYTFNPRGLEAFTDEALRVESNDVNDTLMAFSNATGGFAVTNTNSFTSQVSQIFTETGSYYLLGFRSGYTDGKFRRVSVKVNRPGVSVRTRNGYFAPKTEKPGKEPPPIFKAISGVLPTPDLYVRATTAPFATVDRKMGSVAIVLGLMQDAPDTEATTQTLQVTANAFTREGKPVSYRRQTVQLKLRPTGASDAKYEIFTRLDLNPGLYNLRFGVHNAATKKSGSVYAEVEVPRFEKDRLSLSGAAISVTNGLPAAGGDVLKGVLSQLPTTQRTFGAGDKATVFLRAYQGGDKPVVPAAVRASITDAADRVVFRAQQPLPPEAFGSARAADYRLELPLATLQPGPYLLTVDASIDEKTVVSRLVRFSVR